MRRLSLSVLCSHRSALCFSGGLSFSSNLFPILLTFLRQLPLVGALLRLPVVASLLDRCAGNEYMLPTSMRDA
jgi:hypothetical protein